ncbi:MAG TPA: hypothetical protein VFV66_13080 [Nonomuraea sp.]|nr:hypothetical protein [Nonomuraea sp.]
MPPQPEPPPYIPPSPALGIVSLLMGVIGAAAAFVPILRLPGVLIGLIAATLAIVTVASSGLGGKMIAAFGMAAGLAALPIAVGLHLHSLQEQRADQQGQTTSSGGPGVVRHVPGTVAQEFREREAGLRGVWR